MANTAAQGQRAGPGPQILLLEDSRSQSEILTGVLVGKGYAVTAVPDGVEGLYHLAGSKPALIISDVWMPRLNGYEFCRTVKQDQDLGISPSSSSPRSPNRRIWQRASTPVLTTTLQSPTIRPFSSPWWAQSFHVRDRTPLRTAGKLRDNVEGQNDQDHRKFISNGQFSLLFV